MKVENYLEYEPYKKGRFNSFTGYVFKTGVIPNMVSALLVFVYSVNFVDVPFTTALRIGLWVVAIAGTAQFCFAPITNKFISQQLSTKLNVWASVGMNTAERTTLLKSILRFPLIKSFETYFHFFSCAVILSIVTRHVIHLNNYNSIVFMISLFAASYLAMIVSLNINEIVASKIAIQLYKQGIDRNILKKKNFFGMSLRLAFILYIAVPIIFGGVFTALAGYQSFTGGDEHWIYRVIYVSITDICFMVFLTVLYFRKINNYAKLMQIGLKSINDNRLDGTRLFPVDLATEFSYALHLVNKTIIYFSSMMERTSKINERIIASSQDLSSVSKETETTAIAQSTNVEEILATMVNTAQLSKNIESKIQEVIKVARKTTDDVNNNFRMLNENLAKMREITDSNQTTILGIQSLCSKINNVRDIVNLIDSVAEQTKIIAFNAELEASSILSGDENFLNVANEIRSLADKTMVLTKEIKEKISDIQDASETLILASQKCMEKIKEGNELTEKLEKKFRGIKFSAVTTAEDSQDIIDFVQQQTASFNQLVQVLSTINAGVKNFSESSQLISDTVANLQKSSSHLQKLNGKNTYDEKQGVSL